MKTNPNDFINQEYPSKYSKYGLSEYSGPLTKLEFFSAMALQGLLANGAGNLIAEQQDAQAETFARISLQCANALINELNQ